MNIFTILLMRLIAFALVAWLGISVEWAVALTSDPEIVGAINVGIAAGITMLGEEISKRYGSAVSSMVIKVASKLAGKAADKVVLPSADSKPKG